MHQADMFSMDAMFDLAIYLLKFAIAGGFILLAVKLSKIKKSSNVKAEVLYLQSKLSRARMALKGKIQKKSNIFRAFIKVTVTKGDPTDTLLNQLTENNFETSQDFQNYFDNSRKIVSLIHVGKEAKKDVKPDNSLYADVENDFMCSDFKTEMDIIRVIKEMSLLSSKINARIEESNLNNPSNSLEKVDSLNFDSISDVDRIFNSEGGQDSTDSDSHSKKAS